MRGLYEAGFRSEGMSVELGDDATYLVRRVGSISFQTPLGDVIELYNVLFVPFPQRSS